MGVPAAQAVPALGMRLSADEHDRLRRRYRAHRSMTGYFFLLPSAFFFVAFMAVPIVFLFYYTFHNGGIISDRTFVGLSNWKNVWSDELVVAAIKKTVA